MKRIRLIFWSHFSICLVAHILGPLCLIAILRWCFGSSALNFWDKCLVLGADYCGMVYVVNHISNKEGFCSLTSLEKYYRKTLDLPACGGAFLPRFYTKCKEILKGQLCNIPL